MPKLGIPIIIGAATQCLSHLKTVNIQSFEKSLSLNFQLPEVIFLYFLVTEYLCHIFVSSNSSHARSICLLISLWTCGEKNRTMKPSL